AHGTHGPPPPRAGRAAPTVFAMHCNRRRRSVPSRRGFVSRAMIDAIALTRELVELETPTFREGPVVDLLAGLLGREGYRVIRQPVTPGRDNLYAWREATPPVV